MLDSERPVVERKPDPRFPYLGMERAVLGDIERFLSAPGVGKWVKINEVVQIG